jgi:putative transposase
MTAALPPEPAAKPVEVWFMDEARVGQQGTLTRVWARRGSRPRVPRDRRYTWAWLFGAVCPARQTGAAVIMPEVNVDAMNEHLAEISRCVSLGAIAVLVLDGAGWHSSPRLAVPDNIVLLPLPPYAPELNPMENIWEFLRANFLSHRVWNDYSEIIQACRDAWNKLMQMPERIASIATRPWAQVPVTG